MSYRAPGLKREELLPFTNARPLVWVALWLVTGLAINMSGTWLYAAMWIGVLAVMLLHLLWGLWLVAWYGAQAFTRGGSTAWTGFAGMLVLLPAMFVSVPLLSNLGDRIAFVFLQPAYDQTVSDIKSNLVSAPTEAYGRQHRGLQYLFYADRRDLIVFRWLSGAPDGGTAIVHDATGAVQQITPEDWSMVPGFDGLLYGQPLGCEPFAEPHYYRCHFS